MSEHERRDDIAAYLLGALTPAEEAELERHLEGCGRCREEMRWLEPAVRTIPESAERLEPPRQLRDRLMAEVRGEARDRPQPPRRRRWSLPRLRLAGGLAAAALAVAAFAGYEIGKDGSGGGSGGATTVVSRQPQGVVAKMVREGEGGTLQLAHVRDLPPDKVLEAWVSRDGEVEAVPALFVPDRDGRASTRIEDMSGVDVVMVTAEPRGGSDTPTSDPIATIAVPE
jgi:anti-sigma-K factor RskA